MSPENPSPESPDPSSAVAIVGMAGRFPGAPDVTTFWEDLQAGRPGIRPVTDDELAAAGVDPDVLADPRYVRVAAPLTDIAGFDPAFFGLTPREADATDPQHRLFLECCWEALESAGYRPDAVPGQAGVFGGCGFSNYLLQNVFTRPDVMASMHKLQLAMGNDRDALPTTVSYRFGLRGPSVAVQTFCSTSLVAVHMGVQSLLTFESDVVLAGGASIDVPHPTGYLFEEGGIVSPDGVVRSFDADANGTVVADGVGVVVLKRLADALADGDHVHAVVLGSALNNDGRAKVGFSAPGTDGQAAVIEDAIRVSGVDPRDIGYVECHATGTRLGDSVELSAMRQAYAAIEADAEADGGGPAVTVLGSLKPTHGHLDRASGVAGLIRAALTVEHGVLPATPNYATPNDALVEAAGRFEVLTRARNWTGPRYAGVSSFGLGGTNVHMVLGAAPAAPVRPAADGPHLLVLSARDGDALDAATEGLREHLAGHPDLDLSDVGFTLRESRSGFAVRRYVVADDVTDAVKALGDPARRHTATAERRDPPVVLTLPPGRARLERMGELWTTGVEWDWSELSDGHRRRVALPTYPFQRERHWLTPGRPAPTAGEPAPPRPLHGRVSDDPGDWFYQPIWRPHPLASRPGPDAVRAAGPWLVFADDPVADRLVVDLRAAGATVTVVRPGEHLAATGDGGYVLSPGSDEDHDGLLDLLAARDALPRTVVHGWSLPPVSAATTGAVFDRAQELGFHAVRATVRALVTRYVPHPVDLVLVTDGADAARPEHATLAGLALVVGQEYPEVRCRHVDVEAAARSAAADLLAEVCGATDPSVAYRGGNRHVRDYEQLPVAPPERPALPDGATILITGGLGDVGLALAGHFARTRGARLVLTASSPVPERHRFAEYLEPAGLARRDLGERSLRHVRAVLELERQGAEVLAASVDVADAAGMAGLVDRAERRFGPIDAVLHAAGVSDPVHFGLLGDLTAAQARAHFRPKVHGFLALQDVLGDRTPDVLVGLSSLAAVLGGLGFAAYAGANAALDAYAAHARADHGAGGAPWQTVDWEAWRVRREQHFAPGTTIADYAMEPEEALDVVERTLVLAPTAGRLVTSSGDLRARLAQWVDAPAPAADAPVEPVHLHPRPPLSTPYLEPDGGREEVVARIWSELLGVDRVGVDDDFFELGGHSLLATQLVGRLTRELAVTVPVTTVLQHPTIRQLTAALPEVPCPATACLTTALSVNNEMRIP